jgi:hypothetical protein
MFEDPNMLTMFEMEYTLRPDTMTNHETLMAVYLEFRTVLIECHNEASELMKPVFDALMRKLDQRTVQLSLQRFPISEQ